jgi:hypothetical protein
MRQQAPKSAAERHARKVGAALAKGRMPPSTQDLDDFAADGAAAFETLEALVAHLLAMDGRESSETYGYQYLLQGQLQNLRFERDRGYDVAIGMIENFQRAVAEHATAGRLSGTDLSLVTGTLHQAGIPASAALTAAVEESIEDVPGAFGGAEAQMLSELTGSIVEACEGNAFLLVSSLAEAAHAMPPEFRAAIAPALMMSPTAVVREAAVLMLLDPEPTIRAAAAARLERQSVSLSPISVRRLIAMRNWRPEAERPEIDKIVRTARAKGIDCAAWDAGGAEEILASGLDGSFAQTCLIVSPAGRRKRLSSILCKHGLRDALCTPPESKSQLQKMLAVAADDVGLKRVSRRYLDGIVRHGIQVGLDAGICPPASLLEVAEALGGAEWQPQRLDWREILDEFLAEIPAARRTPAAIAATLAASGNLVAFSTLTDSWFEDDQDVARLVQRGGGRSQEKQASYLLQTVIARRREKWAELFVWTAVWLREGDAPDGSPWQEFSIVADAIAKGHDLARIPLMEFIAVNTAVAMTELHGARSRAM